jgi:hypothetical protein
VDRRPVQRGDRDGLFRPPYRSGGDAAASVDDWLDYQSAAHVQLGIAAPDFWDLTPRELDSLWRAHGQKERVWNYRFGLLASLKFNSSKKKTAKAMEPLDWFGDKRERKPQTTDEARAAIMAWAALVKREK